MDATIETNIAAWNSAFAEYVNVTSKTPQEALEHKVKALGFAIWKGFTAHQFGGLPRNRDIAETELANRTANHRGTKVRATLLAIYEQTAAALQEKSKALRASLRSFSGKKIDGVSGAWIKSAIDANRVERVGAWQSIVQREVESRQSGIGELGAAFLWYRNRGKGENQHLMLNRRGKTIGSVNVSEGVAVIAGDVDGLTIVDARYGVVAKAIADETADTLKFVQDRQDAAAAQLTRETLA